MEISDKKKIKIFKDEIRLDLIASLLWREKKKFFKPMSIALVLAVVYAVSLPRYYTSSVLLAPEFSSSSSSGSLSGLASMVGLNLGNLNSEDAIQPNLYPDLMSSTDFVVSLFDVQIQTKDTSFVGSFIEYRKNHMKSAWWEIPFGLLKTFFKSPKGDQQENKMINPFKLTIEQEELVHGISKSLDCSVDKKTFVTKITVTDQDPVVAATMVDTLTFRLQKFITDYRTKKAYNDLKHFTAMQIKAKERYLQLQQEYNFFTDSNQDLVLESYKAKSENLRNEMSLAYTLYSQLEQSVQHAQSRVLERTPAFTTIQNATVPVRPAGPKRIFIVFGVLLLTFIVQSLRLFLNASK